MQFDPVCLKCKNLLENNSCKKYEKIPYEIKETKVRCKYFTGGEYTLFENEREIGENGR